MKKMQYQVFVKSRSNNCFSAFVIEMPSIAVDGNTEEAAIANAKTELELQLATGKIVTISVSVDRDMKHVGILENDPTFDDLMKKLADIRQIANQRKDEI
jgi:predicted RNase H-like HicB family nuclease